MDAVWCCIVAAGAALIPNGIARTAISVSSFQTSAMTFNYSDCSLALKGAEQIVGPGNQRSADQSETDRPAETFDQRRSRIQIGLCEQLDVHMTECAQRNPRTDPAKRKEHARGDSARQCEAQHTDLMDKAFIRSHFTAPSVG